MVLLTEGYMCIVALSEQTREATAYSCYYLIILRRCFIMSRSNKLVVPNCRASLNQMKYEIASELGLTDTYTVPANGVHDTEFASELGTAGSSAGGKLDWSNMKSREAGSVGGNMTKRLIQLAEQQLNQL